MDKVDDFLSGLNKATRDRITLAKDISIKRLPLASIGLTESLGGGFGFGRQSMVWGVKSAGKSALLMQTIADAQKEGLICAWVDAEASFDPDWAERLGVDNERLIVSPVKTTQEMVSVCSDLMKNGIDVIVVDSITALIPLSWFEKGGGDLKGLEGTKQIGSQAVDMATAVKLLNAVNDKTCLILIAQVRKKIETWGAIDRPTGGQAVEFYSSCSVKLHASKTDKEQKKALVSRHGKLIEKSIGREVTWTIEYNKIGSPSQIGSYDFYYDGEFVGVDKESEVVDIAVAAGIIEKSGAWFQYEELKLHGRDKVLDYFKGNPEELNELREKLANG